jgi:hypothetical protein
MEYTFHQHPICALAFSNVSNASGLKLAVGSYTERNDANSISILGIDQDSEALVPLAKAAHQYPCTKIGFMPGQPQSSGRELLATTSDSLKIFDLVEEDTSHTGYQSSAWRLNVRSSLAHVRFEHR